LPTHGDCRAAVGYQIEEGNFGSVKLHGLRAVLMASFPGAIHQGNGTTQLIIDERANQSQRDALIKILSGQETDDMATFWWVIAAMSPNKLEPLFRPIEFDANVETRRGHFRVPGIVETVGRRADPQPGDRSGASRAYRPAPRLRIPHRRGGQCHDPGYRRDCPPRPRKYP
jgi:hypothetical protein